MSQRVSQERLNEIAHRRLAGLGLDVSLGRRGKLVGSWTFTRVIVPGQQHAVGETRFEVVSHDQLRFLDAPLSALAPVAFYDCSDLVELEKRVGAEVIRRVSAARESAAALSGLGLSPGLDPERLVAAGAVDLPGATVILEAADDGIRIARVKKPGDGGFEVPRTVPPLDVSGLDDKVDLELHLENLLPRLEEAAKSAAAEGSGPVDPPSASSAPSAASGAAAPSASPLVPVAPPGDAPPLHFLLGRFGPHAVVTRMELVQDYQSDEGGYRLTAKVGSDGRAEVSVFPHKEPDRNLFTDTIDLSRAPEMIDLVSSILGKPRQAPTGPGPTAAGPAPSTGPSTSSGGTAAGPPPDIPSYLMPQAGEVWVMTVLVERDDGQEVRYVLMDPEGNPYGAARVLARAEFTRVFFESRGNYRLQIVIDGVDGDQVTYRQLDAERNPSPEQRAMPVASLVASFQPEAALYG